MAYTATTWIRHEDPSKYLDYGEYFKSGGHELLYAWVRPPAYVIAASNAPNEQKLMADVLCDGSDDDADFNTAIATLTGGGTILCTTGTYSTTASIDLDIAGIDIVGLGMNATVFKPATASTHDVFTVSKNFCGLRDLEIDGNKAATTAGSCINVTAGEQFRGTRVYAYQAYEHGFESSGTALGLILDNCRANGCGGSGYYLGTRYSAHMFHQCTSQSNGGYGFYLYCTESEFHDLHPDQNTLQGIYLYLATDTNLTGIRSFNNEYEDLEMVACYRCNVIGGAFVHYKSAGVAEKNASSNKSNIYLKGCRYCNITGASLIHRPSSGTGYGVRMSSYNDSNHNTITGCSINSLSGDLRFDNSKGYWGSNNLITGNQLYGVVKASFTGTGEEAWVLAHNTIKDNEGYIASGEKRTGYEALIAGISGTNPKCTYWENPSSSAVMIDRIITRRTTKSTGAATGNLDCVASVLLDDCEAAWDANTDHVTASAASTSDLEGITIYNKVGTYSAKFVIAAGISNTDLIATNAISSTDISTHVGVAFWIMATAATAAGDLEFLIDEHATCASPSASLSIPALRAGYWTRVILDYDLIPADATRDAIISIGLEYHANAKANTIYIDDVRSIPAPSTTLGNALNLAAAEGIYDSLATTTTSVVCNGQGATTGFVVLQPSATTAGMVGSMYIHFTGV